MEDTQHHGTEVTAISIMLVAATPLEEFALVLPDEGLPVADAAGHRTWAI